MEKGRSSGSHIPSYAWWRDRRMRGYAYQAAALVLVCLVFWVFLSNAAGNLERQGIASGFDFLDRTAGFGVSMTLIDYSETSSYGRAFLVGLLNTLLVAAIGVVLATILGFLIGIARVSSNWLVARVAGAYVEIVRNVPLLLQLFFWYFAVLRTFPTPRTSEPLLGGIHLTNRGLFLPGVELSPGAWPMLLAGLGCLGVVLLYRRARGDVRRGGAWRWLNIAALAGLPLLAVVLTGLATVDSVRIEHPHLAGFNMEGGWRLMPELVALVLALSIYTASFIAENVRAGINSVSQGQREAAMALGLRHGLIMRLIIIPQALRVIIPPLTSQYLNLTKNSSLAVAIAYPDLVSVFAGTVLNQTGQAVEVLAITMSVYLVISLITSALMNWYNARMRLVER